MKHGKQGKFSGIFDSFKVKHRRPNPLMPSQRKTVGDKLLTPNNDDVQRSN
jgi:hypothetical protein